jgi:hypothetical protein
VTLPINNAASFSHVSNNKPAHGQVIFVIGDIGTQIASGLAGGHSWYFYALNVESLDCFTAGINDLRSDFVRRTLLNIQSFLAALFCLSIVEAGRGFVRLVMVRDRNGWIVGLAEGHPLSSHEPVPDLRFAININDISTEYHSASNYHQIPFFYFLTRVDLLLFCSVCGL